MEAKKKNLIDEFLTCSVCLDVFKEPKVLSCIHSFCEDCLRKYIVKSKLDSMQFPCPTCREPNLLPAGKVSELKTNFVLKNMIEVLTTTSDVQIQKLCSFCIGRNKTETAISKCLTCSDLLCKNCADNHTLTTITFNHEVVSLQDVMDGKFSSKLRSLQQIPCSKHKGENMRFFCETCSQPVCRDCILLDHKSHEYLSPDEARRKKDSDMKLLMESASAKLEKIEIRNSKIKAKIEEIDAKKASLFDIMGETCNRIVENVLYARKKAETEIESILGKQKDCLSSLTEERMVEQKELKQCVSSCDHILQNGSDREVLWMQNMMRERLSKLNSPHTETENDSFDTDCDITIKINDEIQYSKLFTIEDHQHAGVDILDKEEQSKDVALNTQAKTSDRQEQFKDKLKMSDTDLISDEEKDQISQDVPKYVLPKLLNTFELKNTQSVLHVNYNLVAWIDKDRFVAVDKKNNKLLIYSISKHAVLKSTKVKDVLALTTFASAIACKEPLGKLTIFDHDLKVERKLDYVYGILSSFPGSTKLVWTTRNMLFIFEKGRTEERQIIDEKKKPFVFEKPFGGCFLPNGNFAIHDVQTSVLFLLDPQCKIYKRMPLCGGKLCTDINNNIYISNFKENLLNVINCHGELKTTLTLKQMANCLKSISVNRDNVLIVASFDQIALIDIGF